MNVTEEGACAICGKTAALRCSNCRTEFYCDKVHQHEDWPRHKSSCRAWMIAENRELGRHLLATRDLNPGDLVIFEHPLIWGPAPHPDNRVCVGCGNSQADSRCPKCAWPACRPTCEGLFDNGRHDMECAILAKAGIIPRCDVLLPLRMLLLRRRHPKRWAALDALQSHEEARGPDTEAYEEVQSVALHLERVLSIDPSSKKVLPRVCGLIDVNALETNPPEGSAAIYEITSLLEHRCIANTRHSFAMDGKGRPCITVTAVTTIKRGEHLSTTYTHVLWATRARRDHLMATKYFACRCERCADPTELNTHLGTLKCPCGPGLVLPKDPLDPETEWACNACSGGLTAGDVMQLTDRLGEEVEGAMVVASRKILADLLARLEVLLHPNHQHCITIGHSLVQLLPGTHTRKAEIAKRIVEITKILDPYDGRLSLYTATVLRELAACPGEDKVALLTRAAILLKTEPANSPGEKLLKVIQSELSR